MTYESVVSSVGLFEGAVHETLMVGSTITDLQGYSSLISFYFTGKAVRIHFKLMLMLINIGYVTVVAISHEPFLM